MVFKHLLKRAKNQKYNLWISAKKVALLGVTLLAIVTAFFPQEKIQTAQSAGSIAPRFNFLPGDLEMLAGGLKGDTDWHDPVDAKIGDEVAVIFYFHNGVLNSVAHHTKLRVDLPPEQSNSLVLKSYLWSQETPAITDTVINNQIIGPTGLTIKLPSIGRVEYVSGSTKLFAGGTQVNMPDGIISDSGLDLGDIQGCWQYAGFVTFLVRIQGESNVVIEKKVTHLGDNNWYPEIIADEGETVAYRVGVKNTGNAPAKGVLVTDRLPSKMEYLPNSTKVYTAADPNGVPLSDANGTIFASGIPLPDLLPGDQGAIFITYKVKIFENITTDKCGYVLNNLALVFVGGIEKGQAQAKVTVRCKPVVTPDIYVDKAVAGPDDAGFKKENYAKVGDVLEYQILIKNTGNTKLTNLSVFDQLPLNVDYLAGTTKVNGAIQNDQIIAEGGLDPGEINPNDQLVVVFLAKVVGCPLDYVVNTALVDSDQTETVLSSAKTYIINIIPEPPKV